MGNTNNANIQTNRVTVQNFSVVKTTCPSEVSFLVVKKLTKGNIIKNVMFNVTDSTPYESDVSLTNHPTPNAVLQNFCIHPATQFIMAEKKPSKL
jgi:hypothetical protein